MNENPKKISSSMEIHLDPEYLKDSKKILSEFYTDRRIE